MNESILNSLMQLYALIVYANKEVDSFIARGFVESYLKKYFNKIIVGQQLAIFDFHLEDIGKKEKANRDLKTKFSLIVLRICEEINKELHQKQKLLVIINLLQFIKHWKTISIDGFGSEGFASEIVETVALVFKFEEQEFKDLKAFIYDQIYKIESKDNLIVINDNPFIVLKGITKYSKPGIEGQLYVYHISSTNTFLFSYIGKEELLLNNRTIFPNHVYLLEKGVAIKGEGFDPLYYSEIVAQYLFTKDKLKIDLHAQEIEFTFPNSSNGIHALSFSGHSGQMIGIMGGSGTGKSTLINLLNGNYKLKNGNILINGHDLHENEMNFEGIIGYIPQDDLLIDELTVFENLYFSAKLCFGNLSKQEISEKVEKLLVELDLFDAKDLKVGNPLNKYISGGQRKRLNIALELIREPYLLFVDEPTSGLSSTDSENVIELLKEQALNGKLLVINIHQPSSTIFKQFDKLLLMDKGGYPIYFGDPVEAIVYVKKEAKHVDATESECHCCGNVDPDKILETIEQKDIDEFGKFSKHRRIKPEDWYQRFRSNINLNHDEKILVNDLPEITSQIPGFINQFVTFFQRNLLAKIADKQYMLIGLLISPVLALILSFLTKYFSEHNNGMHNYLFSENENIPAYIFMSIIVSLFVGLTVSAEEIVSDRKILKRESFLNLSWASYLNAKILFLFILSAIQSLSYVVIGNLILEIKGLNFVYFIVLFSTSCFANLTGLNISAGFKSVVTIYVLIPLILVPQILLSGVIVKFDKLHYSLASKENVPVVGDLMASRWSYEAIMVTQFKENNYQKHFYHISKQISDASFKINYVLPELQKSTERLLNQKEEIKSLDWKNISRMIEVELGIIHSIYNISPPEFIISLSQTEISEDLLKQILNYIINLKSRIVKHTDKLLSEKDKIYRNLENETGRKELLKLKHTYNNERLKEFVTNSREMKRIKKTEKRLIQKFEPVYLTPKSKIGRAHFFSPEKVIGENVFSTLTFNVMVLWLMCIFLYIMLYYNILFKLIGYIEQKSRKKKRN